jgi:hypothetical protein
VPLVLHSDTPIEWAYVSAARTMPTLLEQLLASDASAEVRA